MSWATSSLLGRATHRKEMILEFTANFLTLLAVGWGVNSILMFSQAEIRGPPLSPWQMTAALRLPGSITIGSTSHQLHSWFTLAALIAMVSRAAISSWSAQ